MKIARVFDLLHSDQHLPPTQADLEEATSIWGEPSADTLGMLVWLKMLGEREDYHSLIEGARHLFTRNLEIIEKIESAYNELPVALVVEPSHSHSLSVCRDARRRLVQAVKGINGEYERNQMFAFDAVAGAAGAPAPTKVVGQSAAFHSLHAAFVRFYSEIDDAEILVVKAQKTIRADAVELRSRLQEEEALEEVLSAHKQLQRQMGRAQQAIIRATGHKHDTFHDLEIRNFEIRLESKENQIELKKLAKRYRAMEAMNSQLLNEIAAYRKHIVGIDKFIKCAESGGEEFTIEDIARKCDVSREGASKRIRKLMKDGLLHSVDREGKRHKTFNARELVIITQGWPSKHRKTTPKLTPRA